MKGIALILAALALQMAGMAAALAEDEGHALDDAARGLVAQFVGQLKPALKKALQEGGPTHAVEACASLAPKIADSLSVESGWQVRRVSLRSRNASRASPDAWERMVLQQFDERQAAGEAPAQLSYSEIVAGQYRYMQAQGVEPVCLLCHGEQLAEPVKIVLEEFYPDDRATGYRLGEVRGAISLSKSL